MKLYSPSKAAFYASEFEPEYRAAGNWPDDLREISDEAHAALLDAQSNGNVIKPAKSGTPVASPAPAPTIDEIRALALSEIRAQRSPMLDALSGIAGRAARRGDTATAQASDKAYDALLDITALPTFLAATTYDDMKAAVLGKYREIAAGAPASVQAVFVEVFG